MSTGSALARFTITLTKAVAEPVQVEWFTSDGTAKATVDYAANKGTVVFAPGETAKTVDILVYGRAVGAEERSFFVEMLPPANAILGASIGECIITVDTSGSTPVTRIIVPTGPKGDKGDSPDPAEIAIEVAPLIDVGNTVLTAEGTETLGSPDSTTVKAIARRIAYVSAAKIATVLLANGDNLIGPLSVTGDTLDFGSMGLYPRILRGTSFISPQWNVQPDGRLLIKSAVAGDVLYICQYDVVSAHAVNRQSREALRRGYAEAGYNLRPWPESFAAGGSINDANDVLLFEADGRAYSYGGVLPHTVVPGTTPGNQQPGGLWTVRSNEALRKNLSQTSGAELVRTSDGRTVQERLATLPTEVDAAGTAAALVSAHNNDATAHPQLQSFITSEANRAETAANAAAVTANVFESTAAGIAGTSAGQYFSVVSPTDVNYLDLYRNDSGTAVYQKSYPSTVLVNRLQQASNKLTGDDGFSMDGSDGKSTIEVATGETKALVIGTATDEMLTVDSVNKAIRILSSVLKSAKVTGDIFVGESASGDIEMTEDLARSLKALVIGDALHSLTFDTVNGELITTFKIVDNSQNPGTSFSDEIPSMITGIPAGYEESNRKFQGIPSIARSGSRYWMAWWADKNNIGENHGNFFVIGYSDDNCKTFTQSHTLMYPANNNHKLLDPMLWKNPESGEVWLFFSSMSKPGQIEDGLYGCWCTVLENPNAPRGFSWSLPVKYRNIGDPRRPIRIGGKWMQCVDVYRVTIQPIYPETAGCEFVEFDPRTKSTVNIGHNTPNNNGAYGGYFETELIQRMDGSLMSTTRGASSVAGILWRSFSYDGGKTWSAQEAYTALGTVGSSRTWLGRLPSGRLLIVYNASTNRKALTIKLSEDDGETWPYSVVLEGADSPQTVSYPIVAFDGDDIYTIYDYGRDVANEIRVTTVKETEIVAGTAVPDINIISSAHVTP